jgi:hypothetical protein
MVVEDIKAAGVVRGGRRAVIGLAMGNPVKFGVASQR